MAILHFFYFQRSLLEQRAQTQASLIYAESR